jgi:hypothetical protein
METQNQAKPNTAADRYAEAEAKARAAKSELLAASAKLKEARDEQGRILYEWVLERHPSWARDSVISENIADGRDPEYGRNISATRNDSTGVVHIAILTRDRKASELASEGYFVEDEGWARHMVRVKDVA